MNPSERRLKGHSHPRSLFCHDSTTVTFFFFGVQFFFPTLPFFLFLPTLLIAIFETTLRGRRKQISCGSKAELAHTASKPLRTMQHSASEDLTPSPTWKFGNGFSGFTYSRVRRKRERGGKGKERNDGRDVCVFSLLASLFFFGIF
jgi:hypothetical protein